jgi:hypothetical protein
LAAEDPPAWLVERVAKLDVERPLEHLQRKVPVLGGLTLVEAARDPSLTETIERVLSRWEELHGARTGPAPVAEVQGALPSEVER